MTAFTFKRIQCFTSSTALILLMLSSKSSAQIGAEAQGGKMSMWVALGIDQELSEKWLSITDVGYGRHSDPDNYSLAGRAGLNVLTQDFIYKINAHWHLAVSAGYWKRFFYSDESPFGARSSPYVFRNELRPFQKIIYHHTINAIKIAHALRTDYRFYYDQYFKDSWPTPFEFRLRYMENWKIPLTSDHKNWILAVDELLSAVDELSAGGKLKWSPYQFTENRLSLYYRRTFTRYRVDVDLGMMHQYWRDKPGINTFNISYNLMFDVIIRDPFGKKDKK